MRHGGNLPFPAVDYVSDVRFPMNGLKRLPNAHVVCTALDVHKICDRSLGVLSVVVLCA